MRLSPRPILLKETDGFNNDLFERKAFGETLKKLILNIDEPLVISLEAAWGEGKTTFIYQWIKHVEKEENGGVKCLYFDAFKADFHSDAFLTLATELHKFSRKYVDDSDIEVLDKLKKGAVNIAKIGLSSAVKASISMIPLGTEASSLVAKTCEIAQEELSEKADSLLEQFFNDQIKHEGLLKDFEVTLASLVDAMYQKADGGKKPPLVFIVDELDRCRPDFALQLLEKIKHIFSNEKITFILVNNPSQLEESVRASYGVGIDSHRYLKKFYTIALQLPSHKKFDPFSTNDIDKYVNHLFDLLGLEKVPDLTYPFKLFGSRMNMSFRDLEKAASFLSLYGVVHSLKQDSFDLKIVALFCIIKSESSLLFKKILQNRATYYDIKHFMYQTGFPSLDENAETLFNSYLWLFYDSGRDDLSPEDQAIMDKTNENMEYRTQRTNKKYMMDIHLNRLNLLS